MRLGLDLSLTGRRASGGSGPVSAITTLEILGPTPLLDATGDYSDATARIGINGGGWVAKATMPYLVGQTFDPTLIAVTVSDPGYDGSGTTTVTRILTGGSILRRQYSADTNPQSSNNGITFTVYFSLTDDVYQASTLVAASASSGFYGGSAAGSIPSLTNSSTLAYVKPYASFLNRQDEACGSGGLYVEAFAAHKYARNGRAVARVEFIGTDASAHTAATQTVSTPTLSTLQTKGNIAECYAATVPVTALTQADQCLVKMLVYPWIGDSTAIYDSTVDGPAGVVASPGATLRFCNDKSGTYGGCHVAVKAGASGTAAFGTYAAAVAAPCGTITAAMTAVVTYNNANKGHNDHSGATVWLMEDSAGAGANHSTANSGVTGSLSAITAGKCWTEIKVDPAASGAVKMTMAATRVTADLLSWHVNIDHTTLNGLDGGSTSNSKRAAFDGIDLNETGSTVPVCYRTGIVYMRNVTWTGTPAASTMMGGSQSDRRQLALGLGLISINLTGDKTLVPYALIGCQFKRITIGDHNFVGIPSWDTTDGFICANNRFLDMREASVLGADAGPTWSRGFSVWQNVFERANVGSAPAFQIGADGTSKTIPNCLVAFNTIPGITSDCRMNWLYADVAAAQGITKRGDFIGNLVAQYNIKSDNFTVNTTVTGRVGNHRCLYTVGHRSSVCLLGSQAGSAPSYNSWLGIVWPSDSNYNATSTGVTWTDMQAGGSNPGSGTYTLTGATNAAYDRVAAGFAPCAYDLAGVARKSDGHGACGAYERTV